MATAVVVMVKLALVFPPATLTEPGTPAQALPLEMLTDSPPAGAGVPRVTVAVEFWPPRTEVGFRLIDLMTGGLMVS